MPTCRLGPSATPPVWTRFEPFNACFIAAPSRTPMVESYACAAVNDVGEPCAGEPHARFDRGPLAKLTHGETEQAPHGKPTGLSPPTYGPTKPAAHLTTR